MVALLWADGDVSSTIALEDLSNDLAAVRRFALLCAFNDDGATATFELICEQHTTVIPAESYSLAAASGEQQRIVAQPQHETAALRADLDRLCQGQSALAEMAYRRPRPHRRRRVRHPARPL